MPKAFTRCVEGGGKVRTKKLTKGRYMHICKDKSNKWSAGEVKSKKKGK